MFNIKNIKRVILKIAKLIKDFLFKPKSKEFFLYAFFCGLATIFWFMMALNEDHKENFTIPIELVGVPSNVMLTNTPDSTVLLSITAKGSKILDFKLRNAFKEKQAIELKFDSLLLISRKNQIKLSTITLSKYLHSRFRDAVDLEIVYPDTLEYIYTEGEAKKVALKYNGVIDASPQYFVEEHYLAPDSILVYAPNDVLKKISTVETEHLTLDELSESTRVKMNLIPIRGAKFLPNSTELVVLVDAITEKTVTVPLIGTGFPDDKSLLTFPSEVEVTFQVGTKLFNAIEAKDFVIELPYSELIKQEGNYPIKLSKYPIEVKRIRLSHENVDFLIEKKIKRHK